MDKPNTEITFDRVKELAQSYLDAVKAKAAAYAAVVDSADAEAVINLDIHKTLCIQAENRAYEVYGNALRRFIASHPDPEVLRTEIAEKVSVAVTQKASSDALRAAAAEGALK